MKKTEKDCPTTAMINFVGINISATLIFTIFLGENMMLPMRLIMAFAMVAAATLVSLGVKNLWLTVGGVISAVALMTVNPVGALGYLAYVSAIFLFFRFNPCAAGVVENWIKGIFAPENEAKA